MDHEETKNSKFRDHEKMTWDDRLDLHKIFGEFDAPDLEYDPLDEDEPLRPMPKLYHSDAIPKMDFLTQHPGPTSIFVSVPKIDEGEIHIKAQLLNIKLDTLNVTVGELKEKISREIDLPESKIHLSGRPRWLSNQRTLAAYNVGDNVPVMYENRARLLCTAEGTPVDLFDRIVTISDAQHMAPRTSSRSRKSDDSDICVDNELGFAKDRTISRLTEMNSREYLEQHAEMLEEKEVIARKLQ